jgi:hypothetical protein
MTRRDPRLAVAEGLARAFLAGEWEPAAMARRGSQALGDRRRWLFHLALSVRHEYPQPPRDQPRALARFVGACPPLTTTFERDRASGRGVPAVRRWLTAETAMGPSPWAVLPLPTVGHLQELLGLTTGGLAWFADRRGLERTVAEPLRHYRWRVVERPHGVRLLAAPKPRLKEAQRRLLRHVLARIAVHDAGHGCVPGRSVRTAVAPHTGADVVLRMDLEGFFAGIGAERVHALLLGPGGLPEPVAHVVTGLVTTVVPAQVWRELPVPAGTEGRERHRRWGSRLAVPHLPQGAPTSPALANLVCYRLDRRLTGLAAAFGASYTRYVDDLTFSGGAALGRGRFAELVTAIAADAGFRVNAGKTSATSGARRQSVLGAVVNVRPTLPRRERDALRALLHNCAVHGWAGQVRGHDPATFRDHVLGRVAWAASLDPAFGARLAVLAGRIDWSAGTPG